MGKLTDDFFGDFDSTLAKYQEEDRIREENIATKGNFRRGLGSGIDSTQAMLGGAVGLAGDAFGIDAVRDWGFDVYEKNTNEASLNPLDVQNFTDIESVSDTGKWFAGTIGQLAPSVAQGMISTLAGGAIGTASAGPVGTAGGAAAGMFGRKMAVEAIDKAVESYVKKGVAKEVAEATVKKQLIKKAAAYKVGANVGMIAGTGALEGGGMWGEDAEIHGVENANAGSAFGLGLVSGASEIVSPGGMLIKRIAGVKGISPVTDKVADTFLKRLGTEVPKAMGGEAAQEVFQSFLGVLNKKINDPTVELTGREAILEYINSGAAGAAGGILFGSAGAVFPERAAGSPPPTEELPAEHTVDDVLDNHQAKTAVESAVAREDIQNAGQPDMAADTVGGVLGQQEPGQDPSFTNDLVRLNQEVQEMALSLYPKEDEDGKTELPAWVKLKTLKDWEKETGENVKSYVSSKSAKETLKAVLSNEPLTEKQTKVWGYLKDVAENKAMVKEQESAPVADPNTVEDLVEPGESFIPTFNPETHGYGLGDDSPYAPGNQEETGPIGEEPPETQATENLEQDSTVTPEQERYDEMVKVLEGQEDLHGLDLVYEDMESILRGRPEMKQYADKLQSVRDEAAKGLKNGNLDKAAQDQPGYGEGVPESILHDAAIEGNDNQDGGHVEGSVSDMEAPLPEPSTEKHEVIDNPDSVAHGQEMNTNPSEKQKDAENYSMAHVKVDGFDVSIENPAGSTRKGKSPDGKEWESKMFNDYGRIKGTVGYDKDHVDVFFKAGYQGGADTVHIVNQVNQDGSFDEHKVVMGAATEAAAMALYNANYEKGWTGGKSVASMPVAEFKEWVKGEGPSKGELAVNETAANTVVDSETGNTVNKTPDIIEHTTRKGKIIKGIVRTDISLAEAKAIDKYTFRKDGGFFIREKHLTKAPEAKQEQQEKSVSKEPEKSKKTDAQYRKEYFAWLDNNQEGPKPSKPEGNSDEQQILFENHLNDTYSRKQPEKHLKAEEKAEQLENSSPPTENNQEQTPSEKELTPSQEDDVSVDPGSTFKGGQKGENGEYQFSEYDQGRIDNAPISSTPGGALESIRDIKNAIKNQERKLAKGEKRGGKKLTEHEARLAENTIAVKGEILKKVEKRLPELWKDPKFDPPAGWKDTIEASRQYANKLGVGHGFGDFHKGLIEEVERVLKSRPEGKPEAKAVESPEYGAGNKLVSNERADELRAKLRAKLKNINSGIDPEIAMLGMELAVYHVEAGARSFAKYAKAVTDELGESAKPFLKMWYNAARDYPGIPTDGMDSHQAVTEADIDNILNDKTKSEKKETNDLDTATAELKALDEEIEQLYKLRECLGA